MKVLIIVFSILLFLAYVSPTQVVEPVRKVKDQNLCTICQLFITLVENYLAANATEKWIENILHNFPCEAVLPPDLAAQCDQFIDQYIPDLIDWINKNEPPNVFCSQMGLCN